MICVSKTIFFALLAIVTGSLSALVTYEAVNVRQSAAFVFAGFTTNSEGKCAIMVLTNQGPHPIIAMAYRTPPSLDWDRLTPRPLVQQGQPIGDFGICRELKDFTLAPAQSIACEVPTAGVDWLQIEAHYIIPKPTNGFWRMVQSWVRHRILSQRDLVTVKSPCLTWEREGR